MINSMPLRHIILIAATVYRNILSNPHRRTGARGRLPRLMHLRLNTALSKVFQYIFHDIFCHLAGAIWGGSGGRASAERRSPRAGYVLLEYKMLSNYPGSPRAVMRVTGITDTINNTVYINVYDY